MKDTNILNNLQAFSFGRLQDTANVITVLQRHKIDPADFVEAVRQEKENQKARIEKESKEARKKAEQVQKAEQKWQQQAPKCPDCGVALRIREIRAKHQKQNRFGWRSHWFCPACAWEQYSKNDVQTELQKHMKQEA